MVPSPCAAMPSIVPDRPSIVPDSVVVGIGGASPLSQSSKSNRSRDWSLNDADVRDLLDADGRASPEHVVHGSAPKRVAQADATRLLPNQRNSSIPVCPTGASRNHPEESCGLTLNLAAGMTPSSGSASIVTAG